MLRIEVFFFRFTKIYTLSHWDASVQDYIHALSYRSIQQADALLTFSCGITLDIHYQSAKRVRKSSGGILYIYLENFCTFPFIPLILCVRAFVKRDIFIVSFNYFFFPFCLYQKVYIGC